MRSAGPTTTATDRPHLGVVCYVSLALSAVFIVAGLLFPDQLMDALDAVELFVIETIGGIYPLSVCAFLLLVLALAVSPIGRVRLGEPEEKPEFGAVAWFAMLVSAGVGMSFLFWGTTEPLIHRAEPPYGATEVGSEAAARAGMRYSFLFWGPHAWAIYAVVAISVGYARFRHGRPMLISSALHPLVGDRVNGWLGKAVDILAVFAILFGVATSLGLGTLELSAGLGHAFDLSVSYGVKIAIIVGLMTVSTISAMTGLGRGIRVLSLANIVLCGALLLFVLVAGPTRDVLEGLVHGVGDYASNLVPMSLATESGPSEGWGEQWVYFFWAWWVSWAPFVGTFIARISHGRSIRGVVIGVVLVPSAVTVAWFSVLGGTALQRDRAGQVAVASLADKSKAVATFEVLQTLPLASVVAVVLVVVLALLFITSADSASFMLGSTTSGGSLKPPRPLRLMWSFGAAFAAVLLLAGGEDGLQGAALVAALPFTVILLASAVGLVIVLWRDRRSGQLH